ncbi:hypothetical protein PF005_g29845 [Phytophthora fragariae]|uniref:Uncharacterized protein n=1 Tax=Phytophthora fragariae TaxID=53985 RepID=A0A6A3DDX4_9STRA|nr:hypothetical protein PF003_g28624 [Phytophthora fragariae]KAE8919589.1 hypothetical protein PF009_g30106 [Phytophthora fragariae]KAE9061582.1 hypothetical protein PF007_g30205 [Phytophthora fragariae]KAE9067163.1 hypothetical protein PF006_g30053 [Phytophthora fragariae]KAE9164858.1 hypothetical protein PF005_g29845 [Phytophthora fragariae]
MYLATCTAPWFAAALPRPCTVRASCTARHACGPPTVAGVHSEKTPKSAYYELFFSKDAYRVKTRIPVSDSSV